MTNHSLTDPGGRETTHLDSLEVVVWLTSAADVVHRCIEAVLASTLHLERLTVLATEDDPATNHLRRLFDRHREVEWVTSGDGFARAASERLVESWADMVIFLSDDVVVTPGWADGLLRCTATSWRIGAVGPLSNVGWQSVPQRLGLDGTAAVNALPEGWPPERMAKFVAALSDHSYPRVTLLDGSCVGIRRQIVQQIGGFDGSSFRDDAESEWPLVMQDFLLRLASAGLELAVADDVWVHREPPRGPGASPEAGRHVSEALRRKIEAMVTNPGLARIRRRVAAVLEHMDHDTGLPSTGDLPAAAANLFPRILFLLPVAGGHGGVHVIVENAVALRQLGCKVLVAVPQEYLAKFRSRYPSVATDVFVGFDWDRVEDLGADVDIAIATIFTSVKQIEVICSAYPHVVPAYFIQDYEPWFVEPGSELESEALASYDRIPGMVSFALTDWMRRTVEMRHGVEVAKVRGCLDTELFFAPPGLAVRSYSGPVRVTAMVRPSTPRRSPRLTLDVLEAVAERWGDAVEIITFGCDADEPEYVAIYRDFPHQHRGVLSREGVADLLRECDVFADFSVYQAFGRTALEAMACGCAVILPEAGGADDYAVHERNALVADTSSRSDMEEAVSRLVGDGRLRQKLVRGGLETAAEYGIQQAAYSELDLFHEALARRNGLAPTATKTQRELPSR